MTDFTKTLGRSAPLFLVGVLAAGCGNPETGISNRHLQGIVTLPPLALAETEPADEDLIIEELENDSLQTADGPFFIGVAYHILRGSSHDVCDRVEEDATADDLCGFTTDEDWFRFKTSYQGPIVFKARPVLTEAQDEAGIRADVDIQITEKDGTVLFVDSNGGEPLLDDDGEQLVDDEGNLRTFVPDPRFASQVIDGNEFFVKVTVNSDADDEPVAYELVVVGNDPRNHPIALGIEGDQATFDFGEVTEPPRQAAYEILVGAYLSDDVDNLGPPVGGTSCDQWRLDEEAETFWCTYDMVFVHEVTLEESALIPGMGDGIDNECNGIADSGNETDDTDGDGYTIADGDCNDLDAEVGPFRGDTAGDRKDNDCDGWADNGPDDVDNDGDGYCENGRDLNGDGVCRGASEVSGGLGGGDCNDADARIVPQLGGEIPVNGLDDDCFDGDARIDASNSDSTQEAPDDWTDLEEEACGSDPNSAADDPPADADEDGLCDSDCLGTVGCTQDWDGDGLHNWLELQCGLDPQAANAAEDLSDFDDDGVCDGMDLDADNDGFERRIGNEGDDCNDLNPAVHPHLTDPDTGEIVDAAYNYDVVDGVDNDCDGVLDENRDWVVSGEGFAVNTDWTTRDDDGDGFTLGQRDCNDTVEPGADGEPVGERVFFGNWEVRSANVVSNDFSLVNLFAGEFTSLNSTTALPGERTATAVVPYDLQKERVVWEITADWAEGDPPTLRPTPDALPRIDVWYAKQPEVGKLWFEALDANGDEVYADVESSGFSVPGAPWAEGTFQDLGDAGAAGKTNELSGTADEVVPDTWDGDNDGYRVAFPEGGLVNMVLDWEGAKDLDAVIYCYYFDAINAPNYYTGILQDGAGGGFSDVSKPEEGTTVVPLPPGADCYVYIVQYSGAPGPYTLQVTVLEE
ncbi:MAG: hypothetical protein KDA24_17015 [Deltaproteobacteria bacterium]|nr:hypothetical protein [Deltaproteobacteria bacterium]